MKHSTFYIYNIYPDQLEGMEYYEDLEFKLVNGTKLYNRLYTKSRTIDEDIQMHYVYKAKELTSRLIDERTAV